jgi:hypothetical protein
VLAKLRAAANREGVSIDDAANRLLGNALRTPLSTGSSQASGRTRPIPQAYEYEETVLGSGEDENPD